MSNPSLTDLVRKQEVDKMQPNMEELTSSWLNDPDADAVRQRLDTLDQESWASSAKVATRSTTREFLTDLIDDEMDKF